MVVTRRVRGGDLTTQQRGMAGRRGRLYFAQGAATRPALSAPYVTNGNGADRSVNVCEHCEQRKVYARA